MSRNFIFLLLFIILGSTGAFIALQKKEVPQAPVVSPTPPIMNMREPSPMETQAVLEAETKKETPPPAPVPVPSVKPTPTPAPTPATTQDTAPKTHRITVKNYEFLPASLNIQTGDTVIWTNEDVASHTVEASDGSFESPLIRTNESYTLTFTTIGAYPYFCGPHPYMKASITVRAR